MSGWTAATIEVPEWQRERLDAVLREDYQGKEPWTATGYAGTTVQVTRDADHAAVAEQLVDEYGQRFDVHRIAVVSANDTTDSGYGTLFRATDSEVEEVDAMDGYEGARGEDVVGYFREEHHMRCYATWEA